MSSCTFFQANPMFPYNIQNLLPIELTSVPVHFVLFLLWALLELATSKLPQQMGYSWKERCYKSGPKPQVWKSAWEIHDLEYDLISYKGLPLTCFWKCVARFDFCQIWFSVKKSFSTNEEVENKHTYFFWPSPCCGINASWACRALTRASMVLSVAPVRQNNTMLLFGNFHSYSFLLPWALVLEVFLHFFQTMGFRY